MVGPYESLLRESNWSSIISLKTGSKAVKFFSDFRRSPTFVEMYPGLANLSLCQEQL
jgi:hypothetical protein